MLQVIDQQVAEPWGPCSDGCSAPDEATEECLTCKVVTGLWTPFTIVLHQCILERKLNRAFRIAGLKWKSGREKIIRKKRKQRELIKVNQGRERCFEQKEPPERWCGQETATEIETQTGRHKTEPEAEQAGPGDPGHPAVGL